MFISQLLFYIVRISIKRDIWVVKWHLICKREQSICHPTEVQEIDFGRNSIHKYFIFHDLSEIRKAHFASSDIKFLKGKNHSSCFSFFFLQRGFFNLLHLFSKSEC